MMNSNRLPYFFLGFAAVLAASAVGLLFFKPGQTSKPQPSSKVEQPPRPTPIQGLDQPATDESPEEILANLGVGFTSADPSEIVSQIGNALEKGDFESVTRIIGRNALDKYTFEKLRAMATAAPLKLRKPNGFREVGEVELNALARWAIELDNCDQGRDNILLDLRRENGKWGVEKIILPPAQDEPVPKAILVDSLGIADAFLQAVLRQDFEFARNFVDHTTVSDAKIAALCILFEEGGYRMRSSKPIRSMFQRGDTAGYLANIEAADTKQDAQFALNLRQPPPPAHWLVSELNLDQLLADYATRVAGGDVYYSPLVRNPTGGETIALYFEFDDDQINERTRRQLEIVASLLRSDASKKITLSGHTDALGSTDYNDRLSANRAKIVRDFLAEAGVSPEQIITLAKGASQPRRPNFTEEGDDNPEGRRANRRTEIYLDF